MITLAPNRWKLSVKFPLTITFLIALVAFTVGAVGMVLDWQRFHDDYREKALLLAHSVAVTAPEAILRNDSWALYTSLKNMSARGPGGARDNRIATAMILNPDGLVLAHLDPVAHPLGLPFTPRDAEEANLHAVAGKARSPLVLSGGGIGDSAYLEGTVPLFSDEKLLGFVRVRLFTNELYVKAKRSALIILGVTAALVVLGSVMGASISRRMVEPLAAMTRGLEAVSRGELATVAPVQIRDDDELGQLADTFNKMALELAEKKQLEEQVAISEKLVVLGRIAAGVAHEVNNPLAGLLNCIDTLKKHPDDKKLLARYLPLLDKGLHRIKGIVQGLLIELRVEDTQEMSDLSCLDDLHELITVEIEGRDLTLIWENGLKNEQNLKINSHRIQQIVLNLLKNSLQAVQEGGIVSFLSLRDGDCVVLEVSDNGPGIPEEHRKQLFDPFFTTKAHGTGLGLWIVYRLVSGMRGIIDVESELNKGTRFQVTLPALKAGSAEP